ncbi:MAG: (2Fe-2S) ferredoxin domain-containing protein [Legionellales bacterium]
MTYYNKHVFVCTNQKSAGKQCCANSASEELAAYLKSRLQELGMHGEGKVRVSKSGCLGRCSSGPCMVVYPEGEWYSCSSRADVDQLINGCLIANESVASLSISEPADQLRDVAIGSE